MNQSLHALVGKRPIAHQSCQCLAILTVSLFVRAEQWQRPFSISKILERGAFQSVSACFRNNRSGQVINQVISNLECNALPEPQAAKLLNLLFRSSSEGGSHPRQPAVEVAANVFATVDVVTHRTWHFHPAVQQLPQVTFEKNLVECCNEPNNPRRRDIEFEKNSLGDFPLNLCGHDRLRLAVDDPRRKLSIAHLLTIQKIVDHVAGDRQ